MTHKFFWGASTAAHQVEGNNYNDWTEWELANAQKLAASAERKFAKIVPDWERIKPEATNPQNYITGAAADHYNLYEQDFDILKSLNMNAYRFSIEWSRIEPVRGEYDEEQIAHYDRYLSALRARGIEPFVTLWHWTIPVWVRDQGGWTNPQTIIDFKNFVNKIVGAFKDKVTYWIILNEPELNAFFAYVSGEWPPQRRNLFTHRTVMSNLVIAHNESYDLIKQISPTAQVSSAHNIGYFEPFQNRFLDRLYSDIALRMNTRIFRNTKQDFIALNHYFHQLIRNLRQRNQNEVVSDLGWELYPNGLLSILRILNKMGKPIIITENGLADATDSKRGWYISEVMKSIQQAKAEGINIQGYLHWSLLDNFEWDKGFWPRFGLLEVDYKTQKRRIRDSAKIYAQLIAES